MILEVTAYGTIPLHYQWYYENKVLLGTCSHIVFIDMICCFIGENKSFYSVFPVTIMSAGHYYCEVENEYGIVRSKIATVTVMISSISKHSSVGSVFTYSQSIEEKSTLLSQDIITSADLES